MVHIPEDRRWYTLAHVRATEGNRGGRVYVIHCRECNASRVFKPNTLSDEKLRINVQRDGWNLGRYVSQHLCPACSNKEKIDVPKRDRWEGNFIVEAWQASGEDERETFLEFLNWSKITLPDLIVKVARETLLERWNAADSGEHQQLLAWLEHAHMIGEKKQSLWTHWNKASVDERVPIIDTILAAQQSAAASAPVANQFPAHTKQPIPSGAIRKSDFAYKMGTDASQVSKWLREGLPERADGLLDLDVATAWVEIKRATPRRNGHAEPPAPPPETYEFDDEEAIGRLADKFFGKRE